MVRVIKMTQLITDLIVLFNTYINNNVIIKTIIGIVLIYTIIVIIFKSIFGFKIK